MKPGDWMCAGCGNHNFASRQACNKCQGPRTDQASLTGAASGYGPALTMAGAASMSPYGIPFVKQVADVKDGDWICHECANHNFASRVNCNKCNVLHEGMSAGDWVCRGCKNHNLSQNVVCVNCQGPSTVETKKAAGGCGGKGAMGGMGTMGGMGSTGGMGGMMQMMQQAFLAGRSGGPYPMGSPMTMMGGASPKVVRDGDWMCPSCNNHNFASRANCNKCQQVRPGYRSGDWTCTGCRAHNFASRDACLKCQTAKAVPMV